jgi:glucose-1-phosphate cytidylyltransferase
MKLVILAGGYGTRLGDHTKKIPKPMVKIGNKPILIHIMKYYSKFGIKDFVIALGYKSDKIKQFFLKKNYKIKKKYNRIQTSRFDKNIWNIELIETGLNSLTGLRILKLKKYLDKTFLLTYGDGLSNVNIKKLIKFHNKSNRTLTLTAVHPPARFGELKLKKNFLVKSFEEKPQIQSGWINGGFFVVKSNIFSFLRKKNEMLEREPIKRLVKKNQLIAFKHEGFWGCIDNPKELNTLNKIFKSGKAPWI